MYLQVQISLNFQNSYFLEYLRKAASVFCDLCGSLHDVT